MTRSVVRSRRHSPAWKLRGQRRFKRLAERHDIERTEDERTVNDAGRRAICLDRSLPGFARFYRFHRFDLRPAVGDWLDIAGAIQK